ncbi:MAG: hypothetical protein IJE43_26015 [Alphaproteobacteria bacterium]|nr:hypothetical protein [Alphaproteobacteria bacterium]
MFVAIDNIDMDAFKVEKLINETRDANGGVISPEFAMEILGKTNHFAHIKKLINLIKKSCSDKNGELVADKVLEYKDFILSCVDVREMSPQALKGLQELADVCGCREEFDSINKQRKLYEKRDVIGVSIRSKKEFDALRGDDLKVYINADSIYLKDCNFMRIKNFIFKYGIEINFENAMDFPEILDFSKCSKVSMIRCSLSGVEDIEFRDVAEVDFRLSRNLPRKLDLSSCFKVNLSGVDTTNVKDLIFKKDAEVYFGSDDKQYDPCLFVSNNGAYGGNIAENLDVSMCKYVDFSYCNLRKVKKLNFKKGSTINLTGTKGLPEVLDLSMCEMCYMHGTDLSNVKKLIFKNHAQREKFMKKNIYTNVIISYAENANKYKTFRKGKDVCKD